MAPGAETRPDQLAALLDTAAARSLIGDREGAREAFAGAAGLARELGDVRSLVRAAVGYGTRFVQPPGETDEVTIALLEEALEATKADRTLDRVRLLGQLCAALYYSEERRQIGPLSREALTIAEELGDPRALAYAGIARHRALWEPEHVEERLAAATDILRLAERAQDPEVAQQGRAWLLVDLLEGGDIDGVDQQLDSFAAQAQVLGQPVYRWIAAVFTAMRAILAGDFGRAEELARRAVDIGQPAEAATAVHYFAVQTFALRRDQGRLEELVGSVDEFVSRFPAIPAWRAARALIHQELGREEDAHNEVAELSEVGFDQIPRDVNWLITITLLAEVCAALPSRGPAERVYELLLPYRRSAVVIGPAVMCAGSASRLLGLLATAIGRRAEARRHFEFALRMNTALRSPPLIARTQADYARLLFESDGEADGARAAELAAAAGETARRLGLHGLEGRTG